MGDVVLVVDDGSARRVPADDEPWPRLRERELPAGSAPARTTSSTSTASCSRRTCRDSAWAAACTKRLSRLRAHVAPAKSSPRSTSSPAEPRLARVPRPDGLRAGGRAAHEGRLGRRRAAGRAGSPQSRLDRVGVDAEVTFWRHLDEPASKGQQDPEIGPNRVGFGLSMVSVDSLAEGSVARTCA